MIFSILQGGGVLGCVRREGIVPNCKQVNPDLYLTYSKEIVRFLFAYYYVDFKRCHLALPIKKRVWIYCFDNLGVPCPWTVKFSKYGKRQQIFNELDHHLFCCLHLWWPNDFSGLIVLDAKNLTEIARAEFQLKSPVPKPLHGCFAQFKGEPETKTNTWRM